MRQFVTALACLLMAVCLIVFVSTTVAQSLQRTYIPLVRNDPAPTATVTPTTEPTLTPIPTAIPQPTPTPIPAGVPVLSSSTYTSSSGTRYIVGEVQNNTGGNVRFVKIIASLYDASGTFIGTDYTYTTLDILRPGQRSPFTILIFDPPAEYQSYRLQVEWNATNNQPVNGVTILSYRDRAASIQNWRYVSGEVRNDSGGPVRYVKIVATMYSANGTVVETDYGYTSLDNLAAGQTSPFEFLVTHWVNVARYELQVEASRP
jgi:hypothetical protein